MSVLEAIFSGLKILLAAVSVLTIYKTVYKAIGFFARARKFSAAKKQHSYAIVICARNEEKVIGNLLDSIAAQRYPSEKVKVFVIADNCTDRTAQICRERGAIVYERTDPKRARKGWALQFGFAQIRRDYGTDCADGFLLFDADNLLHPDFLARINEAFDTGEYDVVCGYRNTKNFASNFISAAYGIHFYRSSMAYHRPRQRLHTSTHLAGTGFVIRAEWLKDGWNWVCLTEDTQFTYEVISRGGKIGYCEAAEFYDEQPTRLRTVFKQRIRWAKGRLYAFFAYGYKLLGGMFRKNTDKWACYDMIFYGFPAGLCSALLAIATFAASFIGVALSQGWRGVAEQYVTLSLLRAAATALALFWAQAVATALLVVIRERKKIRCGKGKLALYVLAFPWFDLIGSPLAVLSLFLHVTWKKIEHDDTTRVEELLSAPQPPRRPFGETASRQQSSVRPAETDLSLATDLPAETDTSAVTDLPVKTDLSLATDTPAETDTSAEEKSVRR